MTTATSPDPAAAPPRAAILWLVLLVIGIGWGGTGPLGKIAVSTGHHPIGVTFWNTVIGASLLTVALLATGRRLPLTRRHLFFYLGCGLLGVALPGSFSYAAYRLLPVGVVMIVLSLVPIATLIVALPLRIDRASPTRLLGIGLGVLAVLLIALPKASLPGAGQAAWILLPVVTALSYAGENVFIAVARPKGADPLVLMCGLMWGALLLLTPVVFLSGAWLDLTSFGPPERAILGISIMNVTAYLGFIWLIGHAGPVFASQIGFVVTGSGVVFGMVVFGERHSAWVWAALVVMFAGLTLVRPRRPEAN